MTKPGTEKKTGERSEYWRERIAEQERSGLSVHRFCEEHGLTEQSFYAWRKRFSKQQPVRFALVERQGTGRTIGEPILELVLATRFAAALQRHKFILQPSRVPWVRVARYPSANPLLD
jgi:hypothetical protein